MSKSASRSLKTRLTLAAFVVLVVLGLATAAGAYLMFDRLQARITETDVDSATERLLAAIRPGATGPQLDLARIDAAYQRPLSGRYFVIVTGDQRWRSRSLWDQELPAPGESGQYLHLPGPAGQQLLAVTRQYQRFGQAFAITAALDYSPLVAELRRGLLLFLFLWCAALVATLISLNLWMRQSLQPLARAREQVASVQSGQRQSLDSAVPEELAPLIHQINALLVETRQALTRSRQSLGNLGHALKTPVAVLSALVEREEIRDHPELQRSLRQQVDLLGQRIHRELSQSGGVSAGGVQTPFRPTRDLPGVTAALARAYDRVLTVEWCCDGDPELPVERDDMLEVMGNLLDNAWKWAASTVRISLGRDADHWFLAVEDDGPGIPDPVSRQQALERGFRLDEGTAGQGLGLAIAGDVIKAYKGELVLGDSVLGGLSARVTLPDASERHSGREHKSSQSV